MQKICTIIILSGMLFVGNSIGMELQEIDSKVMWDFMNADSQGNAEGFIKEHPYIVNALVTSSCCQSFPLLHCLVEYNAVSGVEALLEAGNKHINTATEVYKYTPLHIAKSKKMAELLLNNGADLEAKDRDGNTPLSHALYYRNYSCNYSGYFSIANDNEQKNELRRCLLTRGANSNAVNNVGDSLLHRAVGGYSMSFRYPEHIALLLEFGADIDIKGSDGKTAYDCAIERRSHAEVILKALREFNIVFVSDASLNEIHWRDKNQKWQRCRAKNLLELLQNGAAEFKRCIINAPNSYGMGCIKEILTDVLKKARKNEHSGMISYRDSAGYLFNKVNMTDLEEWCGKDSVDYLCQYLKI